MPIDQGDSALSAFERRYGINSQDDGQQPDDSTDDDSLDGDGDGSDIETQAFLREFQQTKDELGSTKKSLADQSKAIESMRQGLRQIAGGEPTRNKSDDPDLAELEEVEARIDKVMKMFEDAAEKGQKMPITKEAALAMFDSQIAQIKKNIDQRKEMKKLEAEVAALKDPETRANNEAFQAMDLLIQNHAENLFGPGDATEAQKEGFAMAVVKQINDEIKRLIETDQASWRKIRRSPNLRERMVTYFVEQNIPAKAKQIIEQERMAKHEFSMGELQAAFMEAKRIKDPDKRRERVAMIREKMMDKWANKKAR